MKTRARPSRPMWAYAYELKPAQTEHAVRDVVGLLDRERLSAQQGSRIWSGKVVVAQLVTHILVVSDDPEHDRQINRRLQDALAELEVGFSVTVPLAVVDDPPT